MIRSFKKKWRFYLTIILLLAIAAHTVPFPDCTSLKIATETSGFKGQIFYFFASLLALMLLVPRIPLVFIAGICFGTWQGGFLNLLVSLAAASACFAVGKLVQNTNFEIWIAQQKWFEKIDNLAHKNSFFLVLAARLAHVVHFAGSSYALGLLPIPWKSFLLGTLIGIVPGTFAMTYVGESIGCTALSGFHVLPPDLQIKLGISFTLLTLVGILPLLLSNYFPKGFSWERKKLHVQAHRGVCSEVQENTLAAFAKAIEVNADSIELDIHVTKDNQIVVYHDFLLEPDLCFLNGEKITKSIPIRTLTYAELKQYDCVVPRRLKVPNTLDNSQRKIPLLKEVFELFKSSPLPHAKNMVIDIEVKSDPRHPEFSPKPKVFTRLLVAEIKREWDVERTAIRSFDPRIVLIIRRKYRVLKAIQLTNGGFVDYQKVIRRIKPRTIAPNLDTIKKEHIELIHAAGIEVMPWTANTPEEWKRLIEMGVDGITTDDPRGLQEFLRNLNS